MYTDNVYLKTGQFLPSISLFDLNTYNKIYKTKNIIYFNDNLGTTDRESNYSCRHTKEVKKIKHITESATLQLSENRFIVWRG